MAKRKDSLEMALIKLKDDSLALIYDREDFLYIVKEHLGDEAMDWLAEKFLEFDLEIRYHREEIENRYEQIEKLEENIVKLEEKVRDLTNDIDEIRGC